VIERDQIARLKAHTRLCLIDELEALRSAYDQLKISKLFHIGHWLLATAICGGVVRIQFENYVLDVPGRELRRDHHLVPLEPQAFDLLVYLALHRDRVVGKDELLATVWKGRVVSDGALTTRINAARVALGDSGKAQRLIRTVRGRGVRFVGSAYERPLPSEMNGAEPQADRRPAVPMLPDQPSLAVLPFENLTGGGLYDYYVDGIVEDVTTALAKWRWFLVIDRNTTFTYRNRTVDARQIGHELGVHYLVTGSVRLSKRHIDISAQLLETSSGTRIWSDRFQGATRDVFAVQDGLSDAVVAAIEPQLRSAELRRIRHKRPEDLSAYDSVLRALWHVYALKPDAISEALRLLSHSLELEPSYAAAAALTAYCHRMRRQQGWSSSRADEALGMQFAERALDCDPDDPFVLWTAGHAISALGKDHARARTLLDKSLKLNPNCAQAWAVSGWHRDHTSDRKAALNDFRRALRLSPFDPMNFFVLAGMSCTYMNLRQYEKALEYGLKSIHEKSSYATAWRSVAVSFAYLGQRKEAQEAVRRLCSIDPGLTVTVVDQARCNLSDPHERQHYLEGLRLAGLPLS